MTSDFGKRTLLAALLGLAAGAASAQVTDYPTRPITLVVCFPAGSASDALARPLANRLSEALHQPVVIDHRDGEGGTLGAAYVAKAAADGYTLMLTSSHHFIAQYVYKKLPYDYATAFEPIAVIASVPSVLVVNLKSKAKSVTDLLALAKAEPGLLKYGSAGIGSTQQATAELFKFRSGARIEHVPYKGGGPMMAGLMAGQIDLAFETLPSALTQIRAAKVRALAVTTAKRSFALPDVPTMLEAGMPGFDVPVWYGVAAPMGTPQALVEKLNLTINHLLGTADFKSQLQQLGAQPEMMSPLEWGGAIGIDLQRWERVVRQAQMVAE